MSFNKTILFLLLINVICYGMNADADSVKGKLPVSIKFGYKSPTDNSFHSTVSGFCFSLSTEINLSNKIKFQPSFILWNSKYKYTTIYNDDITLTTFSALFGYKINFEKFNLLPKLGLGFSKSSDSGKQLLSALYGIEINYLYEQLITLQLEILNHLSAVPDVGGTGQSFNAILVMLGLKFVL